MRDHQGQRWKKGFWCGESGERVNPAKSVKRTSRQLPCCTFRLLELRHADDQVKSAYLSLSSNFTMQSSSCKWPPNPIQTSRFARAVKAR